MANNMYLLIELLLGYLLLSATLHVSIVDSFRYLKGLFEKVEKGGAVRLTRNTLKEIRTQSLQERKKSYKFKWRRFTNSLITNLGLDKHLNPEQFIIWVFIVTTLIVMWLSKIIVNVFLQPLLFITVIIWIYALLYLKGSSRVNKINKALMKAEDLICQNIDANPENTIREITPKVDEIIRAPFNKFCISVSSTGQSFADALYELNISLGSRFDNVCDKMLQLYEKGRPGSEDTFRINLDKNATKRKVNIDEERRNNQILSEFTSVFALLLAFFIFSLTVFTGTQEFYLTPFGQFIVILFFLVPVLVFCYAQYLQSLDYK